MMDCADPIPSFRIMIYWPYKQYTPRLRRLLPELYLYSGIIMATNSRIIFIPETIANWEMVVMMVIILKALLFMPLKPRWPIQYRLPVGLTQQPATIIILQTPLKFHQEALTREWLSMRIHRLLIMLYLFSGIIMPHSTIIFTLKMKMKLH